MRSHISLTPRHAGRVFDVGTRVADEHAPVRHLDRAERFGIQRGVWRQQSVQVEDIGGNRIDILVAEGLRRVLPHGEADVIEQGRSVRPIAADGPDRLWRRQRALAADQPIADTALAPGTVTGRALLIEALAAMTHAAASGRQVVAVAIDVDIPARDLRWRGRPADAVRALRLGAGRARHNDSG